MARADLILDLIKNSYNGNKYQFKKVVEALIAEERSKQHTVLADRLQKELDTMLRSVDSDMQGRNISSAAIAPVVNNFLQGVACLISLRINYHKIIVRLFKAGILGEGQRN